jgi:two-component system cell cycle sensor histidine kinase/response regulator CckA
MFDSSGRILLVDDEPSLLKMMGVYLARLGYGVTTAVTTEQAVAEFSAAPSSFAGAVLDATMPGLPMEEVAMRVLSSNPSLFVIAASGYPLDMSAIEETAPGRVMFLHKPFGPEMLAGAIRRMLDAQEKGL